MQGLESLGARFHLSGAVATSLSGGSGAVRSPPWRLGTTKEVLGLPRICFFIGFIQDFLGFYLILIGFDFDLVGFGFDLDLTWFWLDLA